MLITHNLRLNLTKCGCQPAMDAVQGEANTRQLNITLFCNSTVWEAPAGTTAAVAFLKPDGTRGLYDKLPNGQPATVVDGHTVTAILAPQVLTCAGTVLTSIVFYDQDMDTLATFPFRILVEKNPAADQSLSNNYYTLQNLDQVNQAYTDLLARVESLETNGGGSGGGSGQNVTVSGTTDINIKKWYGKKIVVDGSSITKGETGNTVPTWGSFLKDMFALDAVYNHAVSGTGWFVGTSTALGRVDEYETDADAVIMMGDYNGIYAYTSDTGTIEDEAAADGSYYAKLKYLAEKLIAKYPLCPIIWVVEPPRASVGETNGEKTPMAYNSIYALQSKAIEEVADCYGFTHCNLMKNTIFRPWIQANYDETTSDGTHPWNNIQRTMAQVIAETMKRTPLIYNESYVVNPDDSSGDDTGDTPGGGTGGETEVTLTGITATFTQGDAVIKTTDELDVLRDYLRVVATYSDLSEAEVTDYTLSGELTEGTSTITVTYGTATTTFGVEVTLDGGSAGVNPTSEAVKVFEGKYGVDTNANYNNYVIADVKVGDVITFATNWNASATSAKLCCYLTTLPETQLANYNTNADTGITTAYIDENAQNMSYAYGIAKHTVVQDSPYFMFPCHVNHLSEATWEKVAR